MPLGSKPIPTLTRPSAGSVLFFQRSAALSIQSHHVPVSQLTIRPQHTATQPISATEAQSRLAKQRLSRPVAPHLLIYKPQITSVLSISHRITGNILSGGLYVFGASYLIAPYLGYPFSTTSLVTAFAGLPVAVKLATKLLIAFPFAFHSFNGLRHLVWDTGAAFTNQQVIVTGWIVMALTTATSLALCFY